MAVSRRSFLKLAAGSAAALSMPVILSRTSWAGVSKAAKKFTLSASRSRIHLGAGQDFWAWTYNGQVPGPEIRVREGDTVRVVLKNYLPEPTTIHWHGVPVPNNMDGVPDVTQKAVMPGESFVYEFSARPAGTYFYHSHEGYQLDQGLYGALVIEPTDDEPVDQEYTLILEDWVMRDEGGVAPVQRRQPMGMMGGMMGGRRFSQRGDPLLEPYYDGYAINGKAYPETSPILVSKGDKVKIRLINASSTTTYYLGLAGHALTITNLDGRPVEPLNTDILRISMGERYDVTLRADNPGSWLLSAMEQGFGESRLRVRVQYRGTKETVPVEPRFHRRMRWVSYWDLRSRRTGENEEHREIDRSFSQTLGGGMHSPFWTINGYVYPDSEVLPVRQGERIRMQYFNHSMMPHPMHLHGHFFQVVNPRIPPGKWIPKDTLLVDPMQRLDIEFTADNPGKWFHHCHNLYHMMAGMANIVGYE